MNYKSAIATNTAHYFSIGEMTNLYISLLCDGKKLKERETKHFGGS